MVPVLTEVNEVVPPRKRKRRETLRIKRKTRGRVRNAVRNNVCLPT
tara:strand:+ start:1879 stop:2016 length:138 start_codon:yes stop_codon:yes gene_type:complete